MAAGRGILPRRNGYETLLIRSTAHNKLDEIRDFTSFRTFSAKDNKKHNLGAVVFRMGACQSHKVEDKRRQHTPSSHFSLSDISFESYSVFAKLVRTPFVLFRKCEGGKRPRLCRCNWPNTVLPKERTGRDLDDKYSQKYPTLQPDISEDAGDTKRFCSLCFQNPTRNHSILIQSVLKPYRYI